MKIGEETKISSGLSWALKNHTLRHLAFGYLYYYYYLILLETLVLTLDLLTLITGPSSALGLGKMVMIATILPVTMLG